MILWNKDIGGNRSGRERRRTETGIKDVKDPPPSESLNRKGFRIDPSLYPSLCSSTEWKWNPLHPTT